MVGSIWLSGITVALISSTQVKSLVVCAPCHACRGLADLSSYRYVCWEAQVAGGKWPRTLTLSCDLHTSGM